MPDAPFWHKCNSHCVMCTNCDSYILDPDEKYGVEKHKEKIAAFKADPDDRTLFYRNGEHPGYFLFTGGEPTIHPEFFRLLGEYRKNFPDIPFTLLTNGRRFAYEEFAAKTMELGGKPFDLAIPVHGPDAKTHDSVTRAPGSFDETIAGLHHVLKHRRPGQEVEIRVILHKRPTQWLPATLKYLLRAYPDTSAYRLNLVYFEVEGQAEKNFQSLKISVSECAAMVDECFPLLKKFPDFRLYHFPLCALAKRLWPHAWRTLPRYEIRHVEACGSCAVNDLCNGPHDWYPKFMGSDEFRAIKKRPQMELGENFFHPILKTKAGAVSWSARPVTDEIKDESVKW